MFKPARKISTKQLSKSYYHAVFKLVEPLDAHPKPLQFINIWVPGVDEVPMSISQYSKDENTLSILFKVVGEGTRALRDKQGYFGVKGPLGNGIDLEGYRRVLYIAGGTGIAPLPLLLKVAEELGVRVDVLWGVESSADLFDLASIAGLGMHALGDLMVSSEDCSAGYCGTVVELLSHVASQGLAHEVAIAVGPKPMLSKVCRILRGKLDAYVSLEALVKCGLGACGSCVLKPLSLLLCRNGPVFRCEDVEAHLEYSEN